jgi:hypothetical protein
LSDVFDEKAFDDRLLPRFLLYDVKNKVLEFNKQGISENGHQEHSNQQGLRDFFTEEQMKKIVEASLPWLKPLF